MLAAEVEIPPARYLACNLEIQDASLWMVRIMGLAEKRTLALGKLLA
jgi:hypothetical protein